MFNITPTQKLYALIYYIRKITGNSNYNGYLNRVYDTDNIELIIDNLISDMLNEIEGYKKAVIDTVKIKAEVKRNVQQMLDRLSSPEYGESGFNFLPTSPREMIYMHTKHIINKAISNERPRRFVDDLDLNSHELAGWFISVFKTQECPHDNYTSNIFINNFSKHFAKREKYTKDMIRNKQDISSLSKIQDRITGTFHTKKIASSNDINPNDIKKETTIELWVPERNYAQFNTILNEYSKLFCNGEPISETTAYSKNQKFKTFTLSENQYKSFFSKFFITFYYRKDFEVNVEDNNKNNDGDGKGSVIDNLVYEDKVDTSIEDSMNSLQTKTTTVANNDRLFIACALNKNIPTSLNNGKQSIVDANKFFYKEVYSADYDTLDDLIDVLNNKPISEDSPIYQNIGNIEKMIDAYETETETEIDAYNKLNHSVYTFAKFLHNIALAKNNDGNIPIQINTGNDSKLNFAPILNEMLPKILNNKFIELPNDSIQYFINATHINETNAKAIINRIVWKDISDYPKLREKYINPELRNLQFRLTPTGTWEPRPTPQEIEDMQPIMNDIPYNSIGTIIEFLENTRDTIDRKNHKIDLLNALTSRIASETGSQTISKLQFDYPTLSDAESNSIATSANDKLISDNNIDANKIAKNFFKETIANKYNTIISNAQSELKNALNSAGLLNQDFEEDIKQYIQHDFKGSDIADLQKMINSIFNEVSESESDVAFIENSKTLTQLASLIYYTNILYNNICESELTPLTSITFADIMKSNDFNEHLVDMLYQATKSIYDSKYMRTSEDLTSHQDKLDFIKESLPAIRQFPDPKIKDAISAISKTLPCLTQDAINIHDYFANFIQSRHIANNISDYNTLERFKVNPKAMSVLLNKPEEKKTLRSHKVDELVKEMKKQEAAIARMSRKMNNQH